MRGPGIALAAAVAGALLVPAVPLAEDLPAAPVATPVAALEAGQAPAVAGSPVTLDSSASTGTIADRRWDLDGNGSFETDTGASPTTEVTPSASGQLTVRVQVVDGNGQSDDAELSLTVEAPPAPATTAARPPIVPRAKPAHAKVAAAKRSAPVRAAAANGVAIKNFKFAPRQISVHVGDTITWTNGDSAPHTATASNGSFDTGILKKGVSGSHTFTTAGTISYICSIHPFMKGAVVVAASSSGGSGGSGSAAATPSTAAPAAPAASAAKLPNTGLNLLAVALIAALLTGSGTLLRRRVGP